LKLSTLGDGQTEFGWSFPLWGIGQPEAFFISSDARSHANQRVEPFYLKYHRKHQIPIFIVSNEGMRYLFAFTGQQWFFYVPAAGRRIIVAVQKAEGRTWQ
jgi:hypothetical protein